MFHLQSRNQKCNDSILLMGIDTIYIFSFNELQREKKSTQPEQMLYNIWHI